MSIERTKEFDAWVCIKLFLNDILFLVSLRMGNVLQPEII